MSRDQPRSEAAFSTIWIVVVALMAPGVVILQLVMEPFFVFWTHGKIAFDPASFCNAVGGGARLCSYSTRNGSRNWKQFDKAAIMAVRHIGDNCVCSFDFICPIIGNLGAAIALLLAEIVAAVGYKIHAKRWLRQNQLVWPSRPFILAVTCCGDSGADIDVYHLVY
jgi:hypothetical protein